MDRERFKPPCKLVGTEGNVFAVIARVRQVLLDLGHRERAAEFVERARRVDSYNEVLKLCHEYVDVQ